MRALFGLFTVVPFILVAAACGDDTSLTGGGNSGGTGPGPTTTTGAGGEAPSCDFDPLNLDGIWAVKMTIPVTLQSTPGSVFETCPASQQGEATALFFMRITSLAPNHSARFRFCTIDFPNFTVSQGACDPQANDLLDSDFVMSRQEGAVFYETDPLTIPLDKEERGANFTAPTIPFYWGSDVPLASWDTGNAACDDPALGHGNCEATCVNCDTVSYENDDFPGFSYSLCGALPAESIGDCNTDAPEMAGIAMQGRVFTTFEINPTLSGTFDNSCSGTGSADLPFDLQIIGTNVYVNGTQVGVSELIGAMPNINLANTPTSVSLTRIDGKFGSLNYFEPGDDEGDACRALADSLSSLP
ncbi:MAG: hypothetical protein U0271_32085 [Polyangiaceae bacterium]